MAAHSSVLAWRIPGTGSLIGCHLWGRTESGHDWSDLAGAAAADCSLPGSSVHGTSQARILKWVAVSSSRRGGGEAPKELSFLFLSFFLKKVWVFFLLSFLVFFCLSWVEGGREEN